MAAPTEIPVPTLAVMSPTRVEVVVLTFDAAPGMLEDAVRSVLDDAAGGSGGGPSVELHVIDNGAHATERLARATWRERPLDEVVRLTVSDENRGYAGGMNLGIDAAADADVVVLLNDDVTVTEGWLEPLLAEFDAPDVGAVQPLLVSPGGAEINSAGVVIDRFGAGSDRLRSERVSAAGSEAIDIDVFTGGAVALSRAFIDGVGGFDERFFLYYEDVDLARRGTRLGWRYRMVPASQVEHRGSATTADLGDRVIFLRERNRLWSVAMHGSASEVGGALWLSIRRLRHQPRRVHARALAEGVAGGLRRLVERARSGVGRVPGAMTARRVTGRLCHRRVRRRAERVAGTPGVNIVGYHHVSSGLGTCARELSASLQAAGVPVVEIDNDLSSSPRRRPARPVPTALHDTTIAIVTALEFDHFVERFPQLVNPGKRMIACWLWELEEIPQQHVEAARQVDEVWATTNFIRDAYDAVIGDRVQVRLAPFPLETPTPPAASAATWRALWGDDIVFVVSFDYLSIVERKNPLGAISAFRAAFDDSDAPVRLVVKSINGHHRPDDVARVANASGDDSRIQLVDEHLDDDRHHGLLAAADVLVSLHRSEGYGLHPAIAMWLGTPAIATRYSGVTDFMDDDVAAMVDYELVPVINGQGIYPESAVWAGPDLADAAQHMKRLATDADLRRRLGRAGHRRIADQPTPAQFGEAYAALLRTPGRNSLDAPSAFFEGLDAARSQVATRLRQRVRGLAWPDTARR
jgi:GT2 family glycosyltransferase